jgi:hypothetical protein
VGQAKSQSIHTAAQMVRQRRIKMAQDEGEFQCKAQGGTEISAVPAVLVKADVKRCCNIMIIVVVVVGKVHHEFGSVLFFVLLFGLFYFMMALRLFLAASQANSCSQKSCPVD